MLLFSGDPVITVWIIQAATIYKINTFAPKK